ncbi:MAG: methylmalonyl Co-A mutase-associated GTPase MeaB [Frankiaceae bacterium]|jgi:LAO/AO transport system kinase|nr:methylmalonyl Co-A mutase-associated GTPase MeaB [Frankiaceae bacterium]
MPDGPAESVFSTAPLRSAATAESVAPAGPALPRRRRQLSLAQLVDGVRSGDRSIIGQAVTLLESSRDDHRELAQDLLVELIPHGADACRVGITGVPGAGKSTFIDALGSMLTRRGHRVAVLAVDPSSSRTGGSILGDKTRMSRLSVDPKAFIRPSPSAGVLGGVAKATREAMIVMEAAGYDVIVVETVGVGQSEAEVAAMVDTFLLLVLSRAGDSLQGIKRGVLELADVIAVNKADGEFETAAKATARELAGAIHLMQPRYEHWRTPVTTCSALFDLRLAEVWAKVQAHREVLQRDGLLESLRANQQLKWTWAMVRDGLIHQLRADPAVRAISDDVEQGVRDRTLTPTLAARRLLEAFRPSHQSAAQGG